MLDETMAGSHSTFYLQPSEPSTMCIIGLGLMGGSLALALRSDVQRSNVPTFYVKRIIGVSRSAETMNAALAAGALDAGTTDLAEGVASADVIVLATPVRTILRLLSEVGRYARPGALVMDMGSSKAQICAAMAALPTSSSRWARTRCAARRSLGSWPPRQIFIRIVRSCSARWNARHPMRLKRPRIAGPGRRRATDDRRSARPRLRRGCHQPPALCGRRDAGALGGHVRR